jgi:hypothetical protein
MAVHVIHLKPKLMKISLKRSFRASNKAQHFAVRKLNLLIPFKAIIAVFSENFVTPRTAKKKKKDLLLTVKAACTYDYHSAFKS